MSMETERPSPREAFLDALMEDYSQDPYCEGCGMPHPHCECGLEEEPQCKTPGCDGPVENQYGTCDECQDDAYQGDAFNVW